MPTYKKKQKSLTSEEVRQQISIHQRKTQQDRKDLCDAMLGVYKLQITQDAPFPFPAFPLHTTGNSNTDSLVLRKTIPDSWHALLAESFILEKILETECDI
jgi:hypothetical protein